MHYHTSHAYQEAEVQFVHSCRRVVHYLKVYITNDFRWFLHFQVHYVVVLDYEVVPDRRKGHQTRYNDSYSYRLRSRRGRLVFFELIEIDSYLLHELYQESHRE